MIDLPNPPPHLPPSTSTSPSPSASPSSPSPSLYLTLLPISRPLPHPPPHLPPSTSPSSPSPALYLTLLLISLPLPHPLPQDHHHIWIHMFRVRLILPHLFIIALLLFLLLLLLQGSHLVITSDVRLANHSHCKKHQPSCPNPSLNVLYFVTTPTYQPH